MWSDWGAPSGPPAVRVAATDGTLVALVSDPPLRLTGIVQAFTPTPNGPFIAAGVRVDGWDGRAVDAHLGVEIGNLGRASPGVRITKADAAVFVFYTPYYRTFYPRRDSRPHWRFFGISPADHFVRIADVAR